MSSYDPEESTANEDGQPSLVARLMRDHILEKGLDGETFAHILNDESLTFQDVFGENTLLKLEFDVARIGEHTHFVFIPHHGADPEIITSYPEGGYLRVSEAEPWSTNRHAPYLRPQAVQRVAIVDIAFPEQAWSDMSDLAGELDDRNLNYNFLLQNSNSVAATLAHEVGIGRPGIPGGGWAFGAQNLLYDELAGGPQVPRFMVYGGVSYLGGRRIGRVAPQSAELDSDA